MRREARSLLGGRTFGPTLVRVLSAVGVALIALSVTGWWMTTRVLSDEGFGDVVAKTMQQAPVRNYLSDEITLRLAPTNKALTAARPVAARALAEVLDQPAITSAVHAIAANVHHQVFQLGNHARTSASAAAAATSIRSTLTSIDPALARKVPDRVLDLSVTLTQNKAIDLMARSAFWVRLLYLPVGLAGLALLLLALIKAEKPVQAIRFTGLSLAIAGALLSGLGLATPLFAELAGNDVTGRGPAVAAFVEVLLGRLVGAGGVLSVVGLLLIFAPGRDGADVVTRFRRLQRWAVLRRGRPGWQLVGAGLITAEAALLITRPQSLLHTVGLVLAVAAVFCALVITLRALGVLATDAGMPRLRRRYVGGTLAGMFACVCLATAATAGVVELVSQPSRADPLAEGCNGSVELCFEPLNQIVWPGSHNAMSSTAYDFFSAEQTSTIGEQLNQGARALLIDAYYGHPQGGIVRTDIGGGVNREEIKREFGSDALNELDRLGALTGVVNPSRKNQHVYLCHNLCELGAVKASDVFAEINNFLDRNTTDVLILDIEDYVQPADLERALKAGHLWDRVYTPNLAKPLPTLLDLIMPPPGERQAMRRLIVTSENHAGQAPWLIGSYQLMQETPFTFTDIRQFNCAPNRGAASNPMFLVNHWLRPSGPPDPVEAARVNARATLTDRLRQCITERQRLPNILAVDFFGLGDTTQVVDTVNAAVAEATGATFRIDKVVAAERDNPNLSDIDRTQLDGLQRLPTMTASQAAALLGPVARRLAQPGTNEIHAALHTPGGA